MAISHSTKMNKGSHSQNFLSVDPITTGFGWEITCCIFNKLSLNWVTFTIAIRLWRRSNIITTCMSGGIATLRSQRQFSVTVFSSERDARLGWGTILYFF